MNLKLGRRRGPSTTRQTIIDAARGEFAARGFDATTVRQIAAAAGVDPAMIAHHFGSKEKLFIEVMQAPLDPRDRIETVIAHAPADLGPALVRELLAVWDSPAGHAAAALLRSSIQHDWSARLLRDFLLSRALLPVIERAGVPPDEVVRRTGLVASALIGLVMSRYILKLEGIAAATPEQLAGQIGPVVQLYLTGPLPAATP